jgi:hypothetical protein
MAIEERGESAARPSALQSSSSVYDARSLGRLARIVLRLTSHFSRFAIILSRSSQLLGFVPGGLARRICASETDDLASMGIDTFMKASNPRRVGERTEVRLSELSQEGEA